MLLIDGLGHVAMRCASEERCVQAFKHGELFLGRQDLCDRAEASGLADKPIYGAAL